MSVPAIARPEIPRKIFWNYLLLCCFAAPLVVVVPCAAVYLLHRPAAAGSYIISIVCLIPFVQALSFGSLCGRYKAGVFYAGATLSILAADLLVGAAVLREGAICLLMALPLLAVIFLGGLGIGVVLGGFARSPLVRSSAIPAILLFAAYDAQTGGAPVYATSVADTMTIDAPSAYVWRYIVSYPENYAPADYWLWQIGLPMPTQSIAAAAEIGAFRECRFSKGVVLKEKIVDLVPNRLLTFAVVEQPNDPEILGHLALDKGQMLLEPNADGSTTVIATSWYRLFVAPAGYFDWWAADVTRNIHRRVLGHIKHLAEADWRRDHPTADPPVNGS